MSSSPPASVFSLCVGTRQRAWAANMTRGLDSAVHALEEDWNASPVADRTHLRLVRVALDADGRATHSETLRMLTSDADVETDAVTGRMRLRAATRRLLFESITLSLQPVPCLPPPAAANPT